MVQQQETFWKMQEIRGLQSVTIWALTMRNLNPWPILAFALWALCFGAVVYNAFGK
jgi:hypothetical protein